MIKLKDVGVPLRRLIKNYILMCIAANMPPGRFKNWLYRRMGAKIGKNVFIAPKVLIDPIFPENIEIGDDVFIGFYSDIWSHVITPHNGRLELRKGKIKINKGVFFGGYSMTTPISQGDVTIGEGAVIASHTFVDRDVKPNTVVVGSPCRDIKEFHWKTTNLLLSDNDTDKEE
ncbi:MAG: acyltransferase [Candidatus Thermoplasmatota archaeon]